MEIMRMIVVLSLICGLSGLTLATIKDATKTKIEEQVLTYVQGPALEEVLPPHDNNPIAQRKSFEMPDGTRITIFPATSDGKLEAVALESSAKGYGGDIGVMVGFNAGEETLSGIGITTMKETPGIGSRVTESSFTGEFRNQPLGSITLKGQGGPIDGVSGATYSTAGVINAVNKAISTYEAIKPELVKIFQEGS